MRIERKAMDKEKRFDFLFSGEIFLDEHSSEVYMKIKEVSSYDEDGFEIFKANAVNLSNGNLVLFGDHTKVVIPHSHNLLIEY